MNKEWYMDEHDVGDIFAPTLEAILAKIDASGELGLSSDQDGTEGAVLCTSLDPLSGKYYLVVREQDEPGESALIDPTQPQVEVEAIIGGQKVLEPKYRLVEKAAVLSAIKYFFEHGTRCPSLQWGSP